MLEKKLLGSFAEVDAQEWDALLSQQLAPTPFISWEFLSGLERTGCTTSETGWQPLPLTVRDQTGRLVGGTPLYAKGHSYGEYVFDWAWADAYQRAGLRYFPKFLVASPFSPIPGTRLIALDLAARRTLVSGLVEAAEQSDISSVHVLFASEDDLSVLVESGWLIRSSVQFHWVNRGFECFDDYLGSLTQPKRKKVKAERRRVRDAGVTTSILLGQDITRSDWDFFYACYSRTYHEHHSTPYLNLDFFLHLAQTMPQTIVLCIAHRDGRAIASSLLFRDESVLYGRYWGAVERVDCLHFEVAYYAPIEWAIAQGLVRFEGGAQGEHKLARGFTPVKTYSAHWLAEPRFKDAVARYLDRESQGMEAYVNELEARSPIRA